MICYLDMTFCAEPNCLNLECHRNWRNVDQEKYKEWSKDFPNGEGPVAFADFAKNCTEKEIEVF